MRTDGLTDWHDEANQQVSHETTKLWFPDRSRDFVFMQHAPRGVKLGTRFLKTTLQNSPPLAAWLNQNARIHNTMPRQRNSLAFACNSTVVQVHVGTFVSKRWRTCCIVESVSYCGRQELLHCRMLSWCERQSCCSAESVSWCERQSCCSAESVSLCERQSCCSAESVSWCERQSCCITSNALCLQGSRLCSICFIGAIITEGVIILNQH
jgi:hypothetical protein